MNVLTVIGRCNSRAPVNSNMYFNSFLPELIALLTAFLPGAHLFLSHSAFDQVKIECIFSQIELGS